MIKHHGQGKCLRVSIAVKRHHDHGDSNKGQHLVGDGLQFQRFNPVSFMAESMATYTQADMVLEDWRSLHFDPQAA